MNTLRVEINLGDDNHARIMSLDTNLVATDTSLDGYYACAEALPEWVQGAIAVLSICKRSSGLAGTTKVIEGVGQRISNNIFWLEYNNS